MPSTAYGPLSFTAADGVVLHGEHLAAQHPGDPLDLGIFVAHGFTGHHAKPHVRAISQWLSAYGGVVSLSFRGHGPSGGEALFGIKEVQDMSQVIAHMRELGYQRVVTVGWSMGSGNAILHAAEVVEGPGAADAVVSVSGASRWYLRDTVAMRRVQWVINTRPGRLVARKVLGTRIASSGWGERVGRHEREHAPPHPFEAIAEIHPRPVLVVHGDADSYFGVEHGRALYASAREPKQLLEIKGYGHAETAATTTIVDRIGAWIRSSLSLPAVPTIGALSETPSGRGTISA